LTLRATRCCWGTVVEVALEAAALVVLGGDEALPGVARVAQAGLEVGAEAHVLEDQAGLVGKVVHELDLDGAPRRPSGVPRKKGPRQSGVQPSL
jgi:hypothetical protein